MKINVDGIATAFKMKPAQTEALRSLATMMEADVLWTDTRHAAYFLGTIWHETAHTWKPIYERGPRAYFDKYEGNTALGKRLGNVLPGDGFRYRGAGHVQITGRANYKKLGKALGVDLENHPELALDPVVSYRIAALGMRAGLFTGKKLDDYFNNDQTNWLQARRIINHLDKADLIAGYAQRFQTFIDK